MSVSKTAKQKEHARETRQSLIDKVKSYWPDLAINDGNLQNPTQSFVYTFYSRFYSEYEKNLFEIKTNLLKQEPEQLVDYHIYTDEISLGIKLRKISKLVNEQMPFYMNDIFEPQPRRTVLFFSLFMNHLIYMKTDTLYVDEICEVVQKAENFQNFYDEKQQLLEEIAKMNLLHFKLENNIKKFTEGIETISNEYKNILMQKTEKEYEYQNNLKATNKLKENITSFDEYLVRLREECSTLQEQFVEETEINEMKNKMVILKQELDKLDIDRSTIVSSLEEQEEITKHYNKCLALLQHREFNSDQLNQLESSIESVVATNQEVNKLKKYISNELNEVNELKNKQKHLKENISLSEQKLLDLKITIESSIKELQEKFNTLSVDIPNEQNECRNFENEIEQIENMISVLKKEKSLLKAAVKEEYRKLIENHAIIYETFNNALMNIDKNQNLADGD